MIARWRRELDRQDAAAGIVRETPAWLIESQRLAEKGRALREILFDGPAPTWKLFDAYVSPGGGGDKCRLCGTHLGASTDPEWARVCHLNEHADIRSILLSGGFRSNNESRRWVAV